jgi:hypothetical protein
MSEVVGTVLSDLQRFSNLHTLSIEFPFDWVEWDTAYKMFESIESAAAIENAEENEGWRAKSFQALTQNTAPCFKTLETRKLVAKEVSTFTTEAFSIFLGHVERFKLWR